MKIGLLSHTHNSGLSSLQRILLPDVNLDRVILLKDHAVYGKEPHFQFEQPKKKNLFQLISC